MSDVDLYAPKKYGELITARDFNLIQHGIKKDLDGNRLEFDQAITDLHSSFPFAVESVQNLTIVRGTLSITFTEDSYTCGSRQTEGFTYRKAKNGCCLVYYDDAFSAVPTIDIAARTESGRLFREVKIFAVRADIFTLDLEKKNNKRLSLDDMSSIPDKIFFDFTAIGPT